jgi:formylglycine-generating enzyme required for sulfatase activity
MAGNAWESNSDTFYENYYASSPNANPQGAESFEIKVLHGGSWNNTARNTRARSRNVFPAINRVELRGFRCARSPSLIP